MPRRRPRKQAQYDSLSTESDGTSSSDASRTSSSSGSARASKRRTTRKGRYGRVPRSIDKKHQAYPPNYDSDSSDSSSSDGAFHDRAPAPPARESPWLLYLVVAFIGLLAAYGVFLIMQGSDTVLPPLPSTTTASQSQPAPTGTRSTPTTTKTATKTTPSAPSGTAALPSTKCTFDTSKFKNVIRGPGDGADWPVVPRPSTFVKREGNKLTLDGKDFPFTGPNIYWLGLDENVVPKPSYPDKRRVTEIMAMTVAMGGTVIRAHTLGISTGHPLTLMASANKTSDEAFEAIDYAIWAAWSYGLRLIIPLTDEHNFYHGGKGDFLTFAGASEDDDFYDNGQAQAYFRSYIEQLLTHVNTHTGVALKDDPTILGWETGNEWGQYMLKSAVPSADWTDSLARFIKALAPEHLVADGTNGFFDESGVLKTTAFDTKEADLITDHLYPASVWLLDKDRDTCQDKGSEKVFFIGELDVIGQKGGDKLAEYYAANEAWTEAGSLMWSLFGHDGECCSWVDHNDGYTIQWGSDTHKDEAFALAQHWYRKRGLSVPKDMTGVACPQPELS